MTRQEVLKCAAVAAISYKKGFVQKTDGSSAHKTEFYKATSKLWEHFQIPIPTIRQTVAEHYQENSGWISFLPENKGNNQNV